jgi:hypothetical protein
MTTLSKISKRFQACLAVDTDLDADQQVWFRASQNSRSRFVVQGCRKVEALVSEGILALEFSWYRMYRAER